MSGGGYEGTTAAEERGIRDAREAAFKAGVERVVQRDPKQPAVFYPPSSLSPCARFDWLRLTAARMQRANEAAERGHDEDAQDEAARAFDDAAEKLMLIIAGMEARGIMDEIATHLREVHGS